MSTVSSLLSLSELREMSRCGQITWHIIASMNWNLDLILYGVCNRIEIRFRFKSTGKVRKEAKSNLDSEYVLGFDSDSKT